jgi:hypothetical protein
MAGGHGVAAVMVVPAIVGFGRFALPCDRP